LYRSYIKNKYTLNSLVLCFFMLMACFPLVAQELSNEGFEAFRKRIESLQGTDAIEAYNYLKSLEVDSGKLSIENRLVFYRLKSELLLEQGQYQLSEKAADAGLNLAFDLKNPTILISELSYAKGFAVESLGDYEGAKEAYVSGLEVAESLNDEKNIAMGLINLGALYYLTEHFERALIVFNDALTIANNLQDNELQGYVNTELGILYSYLGKEEKSMRFYQRSYEHYQAAGKISYAYNSLRSIAVNHAQNERYDEAIKLYNEIISHADKLGNIELMVLVYSGMAWAQLKKDDADPEAAYEYISIASEYAQVSEQHETPVSHAIDRAYIMMEMERYQEALESITEAEKHINDKKRFINTLSRLNTLYLKKEIYFTLEEYEKAYQVQSEYLDYHLSIKKRSNFEAVEELRMRYESEQADLEKKILEQKESLQSLRLVDAKSQVKNRQLFIALVAVFSLILAWFLVKILRGQSQLLSLSRTDSLTGVANRRRLMQLGMKFFIQAKQQHKTFSLLMLDVDDFKVINDGLGHKHGDRVLKGIAQIGAQALRKDDKFGRFGGEEFIALLPQTNQMQAREVAQRIVDVIKQYPWKLKNIDVSVSIGVATLEGDNFATLEDMIKQADVLLYRAKRSGKNQVCCTA